MRMDMLFIASLAKLIVNQSLRCSSFNSSSEVDGFAWPSSALMPSLREAPTDYVGNLVYKKGVLDKILIDGGYISGSDMNYHFFVTDHLCNVRVVVNDAGVVEQVNQFYPYGEATDMRQALPASVDNPYKWVWQGVG